MVKNLLENFANDDILFDYVNSWNVFILKKKIKTKNMIIKNLILVFVLVCIIVKWYKY